MEQPPRIADKSADHWLPRDQWKDGVCQHTNALIDYLRKKHSAEVTAVSLNNVKTPEYTAYVSVPFDEPLLSEIGTRFPDLRVFESRAIVCNQMCYCSVESAH